MYVHVYVSGDGGEVLGGSRSEVDLLPGVWLSLGNDYNIIIFGYDTIMVLG